MQQIWYRCLLSDFAVCHVFTGCYVPGNSTASAYIYLTAGISFVCVKEKNGRICKMTDTSVSISAPVFFLSVHPQTSKKSEFQVKHFCQYL